MSCSSAGRTPGPPRPGPSRAAGGAGRRPPRHRPASARAAVPARRGGGEAGHDVEAEAETVLALLVVRRLRVEAGEAGVQPLQPVRGHTDALVLDGEHDLAVLQQPAGDLDGQVGRGERGGVLHEFGQQVREVVRGEPGDVRVRRQRGDPDPLVPLDLADRGADDVHERHGPGRVLDVFGAGEDQEVLAVPAHDRREVVELEERGEALRVLLALLQVLDDGQLPLDQAEGAQGEVDEGAADGGAQPLQLGGGLGEFAAQFLAGVGHLLALADEVLAVGLQRADPLGEGGGVRVQGVDGADDLGELVVAAGELHRLLGRRVLGLGQALGAQAQHGQGAGEAACHARGDADGEQHEGAEDGDADLQRGDVVVAQRLQVLGPAVVEGGLHAAHHVDAGGQGRVQLLGAGGEFAAGEARLVGQGGEVLLGGVDLGAGDRVVERGAGRLGGGGAEVGQGRVGAQPGLLGGGAQGVALPGVGVRGGGRLGRQAGDGVDARVGAARHAEGGEQQAPGGGGLLDGGVQFGEGVAAGAGAGRRLLGQLFGEPVEFGDGGGVRLVRFEGAALAGERRSAYGGYVVEVRAERGGRVGVRPQFLHLPVHAGAVLLGGCLGLGSAGRDVGGEVVALVGEGVREGEGVLRLPGERHELLRVVELPGGGEDRRGTGTGDGRGDHGHGDDEPVAYMGGAALAGGGRRLSALNGGRLLACATRPRLLHRCSHS